MSGLTSSRFIASILLLFVSISASSAQIFYDPAVGLPQSQGWNFLAFGSAIESPAAGGGIQLDTSDANSTQAGYSRVATGLLNRTNGFAYLFTVQMVSEGHTRNDRAGLAIILLADDKRGIEFGFWTNSIFAQSDSPLFTRAEDTNFTTTASVDYALTFHATNYVLSANGTNILTGPVRDYTAFAGFPNPYSTPDFLFFGDDTTSALGTFILRKVLLITAPQLSALPDNRIVWTGVSNQTYTVLSSSNLIDWPVAGAVTSATSDFVFTNTSSASAQFFRVTFP
jgi:hypothetical protein